MLKRLVPAALAVSLLLPVSSALADDIVEIAAGNTDFSTLVAAVTAADLVGTLQSEGPFTVFAPTDEAFAKLPDGVVEKLLLPENKDLLTELLTFHVVSGKVLAADVVGLKSATTASGEDVKINVNEGVVMVGNAKVVATDIMADNGVIHVVDSVLLPKSFVGRLNKR